MAISKVFSSIAMFSSSMSRVGDYLRNCIGWMLKVANTWGKKHGGRVRFHWTLKRCKKFLVVHIVFIFVSRCNILSRLLECCLMSLHASIPTLTIICWAFISFWLNLYLLVKHIFFMVKLLSFGKTFLFIKINK